MDRKGCLSGRSQAQGLERLLTASEETADKDEKDQLEIRMKRGVTPIFGTGTFAPPEL